jgi:arsenite-transporting ATPase
VARQTARLWVSSPGDVFEQPVRLLMFGGKGGVGKTTCAAAAALQIASARPDRRVLLISIDPAHSLADVLAVPLSDQPQPIPGTPANLHARELDASRALDPLRREYAASIDALFDRLSRGSSFDARHDRQVMHDLLDLAPPGLDEVSAVIRVVDLLGGADAPARYDTIVIDTAPTGHALRLLETPAALQDWTKALMAIVLKYQPVIGIGELGAALLRLSRGLGRLRDLLIDPHQMQFVMVTRSGSVPDAETRRLNATLRRLKVPAPAVIVNAAGAGDCRRCRRAIRRERVRLASLARSLRIAVFLAPAVVPPPVGREALLGWRRQWRRYRKAG